MELDRLKLKTLEKDRLRFGGDGDPDIDVQHPSKSMGGVEVKTIKV